MPIFRGRPELLRQFRQGDRAALEEVYFAYVDRIQTIVRHGFRLQGLAGGGRVAGLARRPFEIADLVQDVFARAFAPSARNAFDGLREYGPYIQTVARNVLMDWARRQGREVPTGFASLEDTADRLAGGSPDHDDIDPETLETIRGYLDTLEPALRAVHHARYVDSLSQEAAARELGVSRQSLRTLEGRLRTGLRKTLRRAALVGVSVLGATTTARRRR